MIDDFLESDHEALSKLSEQVDDSLGQADLPRAFKSLDLFWARLATHIRAENLCLFPTILGVREDLFAKNDLPSIEDARATIDSLRADHNFFMDELITIIKLMRVHLADSEASDPTVLAEEVRTKLARVKQRLESHNQLEEKQVYRWPSRLLTESELNLLESQIRHQVENLPPRFNRTDN